MAVWTRMFFYIGGSSKVSVLETVCKATVTVVLMLLWKKFVQQTKVYNTATLAHLLRPLYILFPMLKHTLERLLVALQKCQKR